MNIAAHMPVFGQSGVELLCRNMLIALDKLGVNIALQPAVDWNFENCVLRQEDKERLIRMCNQHVPDDSVHLFFRDPAPGNKGKVKICITLFETDKCPRSWIAQLNQMTEVWVFSAFNHAYWIQSGVDANKLHIMPFGIDTRLYNPSVKPMEIVNKKQFVFLTNGDYTERKNFEALIEAFVKEFKKEDDTCLVVKAHANGFTRKHERACIDRLRQCVKNFSTDKSAPVMFFGKKMAADEMGALYTMADCFVLPSRGEGLGLCIAEAMACGIPVIATGWSAYMDFLNEENGFPVDYKLEQIDDTEFIRKCLIALNHNWAQINIDRLREAMRFVHTCRDEAKRKAELAYQQVHRKDWQTVGLWIVKRLIERVKQ